MSDVHLFNRHLFGAIDETSHGPTVVTLNTINKAISLADLLSIAKHVHPECYPIHLVTDDPIEIGPMALSVSSDIKI